MLQEVKEGLGRYMGAYFDQLVPTTKAMRDYVQRELKRSIVWGAGRQVDSADDMLESYRKNDNTGQPGISSTLPIIIITLARDMIPALEWGRNQGNPFDVIFPEDPKGRVFKLRTIHGETRAQVVFIAADEPTARSMAMQFALFVSEFSRRRFRNDYRFAGFDFQWPTMIETPDIFQNHSPNEQKNICILSQDLTLRLSVPLIYAPRDPDLSDGKGSTDANGLDPSGFGVVTSVVAQEIAFPVVTTQNAIPADPMDPDSVVEIVVARDLVETP